MHVFQPIDANDLEINPFELYGKHWGAVTAMNGKKVNAMTIAWGGMGVLWGVNTATIYVRQTRYTKEFLDASDTFSISFFNDTYKGALKYLGQVSGRDEDKIKNARLHVNLQDETPFIDEANFVLICKKLYCLDLPTDHFTEGGDGMAEKFYSDEDAGNIHTMYIGQILTMMAR